jgi:hypothetical protein
MGRGGPPGMATCPASSSFFRAAAELGVEATVMEAADGNCAPIGGVVDWVGKPSTLDDAGEGVVGGAGDTLPCTGLSRLEGCAVGEGCG